MIWIAGSIKRDDEVTVSVLDRTFEHGLGLFETFRTWNGQTLLFDRHRERMFKSAKELGLPTLDGQFPDEEDIKSLREANGPDEDVVVRITLSGGFDSSSGSRLWMRTAPIPPLNQPDGAVIRYGFYQAIDADPLARHKTLNYWLRRIEYERARASGADERLGFTSDGRLCEGTRTNVFLVRDGELWTPSLDGPILPGIMRGFVLEVAQRLGIKTNEVELNLKTIERADEVFLTNSVRSIMPVGSLWERTFDAPGPITRRLRTEVIRQLEFAKDRQP